MSFFVLASSLTRRAFSLATSIIPASGKKISILPTESAIVIDLRRMNRIIELNPKLATADNARNRLSILKLELKAKEKSQVVKLGSYEQNIGLKKGLPPLR